MIDLVIHSGAFKTGSTAIQQYLRRAADRLEAERGVVFPDLGRPRRAPQHSNLAAEVRGDKGFMPDKGSWEDVFGDATQRSADRIIVSSESFSMLGDAAFKRLGRTLQRSGARTTWIHYIRDQASLINSFYVERIVNLRPEFVDLIDNPIDTFAQWSPIALDFLDYAGYFELIQRRIPEVTPVFRVFEPELLQGGDAVRDFCATVDIPFYESVASATNVGMGWKSVETARRLTKVVARAESFNEVNLRTLAPPVRLELFSRVRGRLRQATNDLGWNSEPAIYATPQFYAATATRYESSNARLAELLGPDEFPGFTRKQRSYNIGDVNDITPDEMIAVFAETLRPLSRIITKRPRPV